MNGKMRRALLAATAGALLTMAAGAMAQAPGGGAPGAGPPRGGPGMGGGFGQPTDRAGVIQQFGLGDAALKLTDAQKGEIDKAADGYLAATKAITEKYPMAQGSPPSQETMQAMRTERTKARDDLTAAVNKVLNDEQKKTWEAAQAARRQGGPGGGMRGPGGGMGGPGGAPPGGA